MLTLTINQSRAMISLLLRRGEFCFMNSLACLQEVLDLGEQIPAGLERVHYVQ
jgi:hypothetical protein